MIKKILAVALAIVLTVLVFAGCSKKAENVDVNGVDKPVAYNENGYAIFDEEGHIRIYDTDENGRIIYDEQGNPGYKYYDGDGYLYHDGMIDTPQYALAMPSGWEYSGTSTFFKKDTDNKCKVQIFVALEDGTQIESFVATNRESNKEVMAKTEAEYEGYKAEMTTDDFVFGTKEIQAYTNIYKVTDADGKLVHYAVDMFVLMDGKVYDINYLCTNGIGYDESFDFVNYIKENFIAK